MRRHFQIDSNLDLTHLLNLRSSQKFATFLLNFTNISTNFVRIIWISQSWLLLSRPSTIYTLWWKSLRKLSATTLFSVKLYNQKYCVYLFQSLSKAGKKSKKFFLLISFSFLLCVMLPLTTGQNSQWFPVAMVTDELRQSLARKKYKD